jgi:V/A-type H+/Na+-transporting ATPase subunit E
MSDEDQIAGLEAALSQRAKKLADEYLASGGQIREQILADARQRLHLEEEREVLAAKAQAERTYQQLVQAAELQLRSELDRLRMELVNTVLGLLPTRLTELATDEQRYLPLLRAWLREGAQAIERDELVVQVNQRDWQRLHADWEKYAKEAAPGKHLVLSDERLDCTGGVLISSSDTHIRLDNTFEGRKERLGDALQNAVAEQLLPPLLTGGN